MTVKILTNSQPSFERQKDRFWKIFFYCYEIITHNNLFKFCFQITDIETMTGQEPRVD